MAAIVESFLNDRQLQLGDEQFFRRMAIGYNWYKIRVGVRYSIQTGGGFNMGFAIGVSAGGVQYSDGNADMAFFSHGNSFPTPVAVGMSGSNNILTNWTYCCNTTKVGATVTRSAVGTNSNSWSWANWAFRGMALIDISRTAAATLSFQPWTRGTNWVDMTQGDFFYAMEQETTPGGGLSSGQAPAGAIAYTGSGFLDSVYLGWTSSVPVINISDIAVVRFA